MAHALLFEFLTIAYYESGESERAEAEYEKIDDLTIRKLWFGDIFTKKRLTALKKEIKRNSP